MGKIRHNLCISIFLFNSFWDTHWYYSEKSTAKIIEGRGITVQKHKKPSYWKRQLECHFLNSPCAAITQTATE